MKTPIRYCLIALFLLVSCKEKPATHEPHGEEGDHAHEEHAGEKPNGEPSHQEEKGKHNEKDEHDKKGEHPNEKEHEGEIHVSKEAMERAGIVVAKAERRALTGGSAIPAEVQFEPSSTAHVGPLVPGRITRVAVALGDKVKRGQLLGVVASSDVSSARSRLDQASARLLAAESTLKRQTQLSTEGIGAQRSLVDAEAQAGELRAEVAGLKRQLSVFGSGGGGALSLTSPIDGVVVALHGTLGETATPDQPAFIITDPNESVGARQCSGARAGSRAFGRCSRLGAPSRVSRRRDARDHCLRRTRLWMNERARCRYA